ncbi:MAG: stage III sporulation protein AB [Clostridia bacterium]|nr:stage III sporulation protein AB [Clostridia bacterium]
MNIVFKIVISCGIIALCGYAGIMKSKKLETREQILREMVIFLNLVKNDIRYMMNILPNAYEIARQKLSTSLKIAIGKIVIDMINYSNHAILEQSIMKNISDIDELTKYDKEVFISTLKNLGRSDLESQINIIDNSIHIIENQIKEANEIKLKNSKLYRTVGVITGLMIVIVFI